MAEEACFAVSPSVKQQGEQYRVEFSAAAPTDCAVWILDGRGSVVRHLAAGVLGPNAPPPLQQNSLAQSLSWDGNDDAGRAAADRPWKVRVALGLAPKLDGFLGFEPLPMSSFRPLDSIRALAVGPQGEVFVFYCFGSLALDEGREGGFYGKPVDAIYRFGWNDREPTLLVLRWSGAAGEHGLNDPKGIAVDREGNVLVADKGRVVATTTIPFFKHEGYRVTMALDDRAERPILWIATAASRSGGARGAETRPLPLAPRKAVPLPPAGEGSSGHC